MKSTYIILPLFIGINAISCNKFLDKKNDDKLSVPSSIPSIQALLDNTDIMNIKTPNFGEASTDNYFVLEATFNSRSEREKNIYQWMDPQYTYGTDWSNNYLPIYNANLCLEQIEKVDKTGSNESEWNLIKGSSFFFRAFYFQQLLWVYAKAYDEQTANQDMGIVLRLSSDFNIPSVRSSVLECYKQIEKDAKAALEYLPATSAVPTRPSQAAAYGLLARNYLSIQNYDSALAYANRCLALKNKLMNFNGPVVSATATFPFPRFNDETVFYTQMTALGLMSISNGLIDTTLYNSFETNDLRKKAYFTPRTGYQRFKGNYSANSFYFTGITTDEMYLTRAEAYARSGNKEAAMKDLNDLLYTRWAAPGGISTYVDMVANDAEDALAKILVERRKELIFRGIRWSDIKRLNKENANIVLKRKIGSKEITLEPNSSKYALPLPVDIINLTGMTQN